jgi:hypothetical protein
MLSHIFSNLYVLDRHLAFEFHSIPLRADQNLISESRDKKAPLQAELRC